MESVIVHSWQRFLRPRFSFQLCRWWITSAASSAGMEEYIAAFGQVLLSKCRICSLPVVSDELSEKGLFPRSRISDHTLEDFALIVEHEPLPYVTYPFEWSFDMFRDAALAVLGVSEIAARYGWGLKDCHPYNVIFDGIRPQYVDMGSFVPAVSVSSFQYSAEFLACYWRPLSIWAAGDHLAQRIISSAHVMMPLAGSCMSVCLCGFFTRASWGKLLASGISRRSRSASLNAG